MFTECGDRLYFKIMLHLKNCVAEEYKNNSTKQAVNNYYMLTAVSKNKEFYTQQEIKGADSTRKIQNIIVWPRTADFKNYTKRSLLHN